MKKENIAKYAIIIFMIIFLFNFARSFQGIDVTDEGWSLTLSWMANEYNINPEWSSISLSNYIGGAWLSLSEPSLIWARLGGSILIALTSVMTFLCLCFYYKPKQIFKFLLPTGLIISTFNHTSVINYFTLPAFFSVLLLFLYSYLFYTNDNKTIKITNFLIGLLLAVMIFSRITLILALALPILLKLFYDKKNKINLSFNLMGLISGIACILLIYNVIGYLPLFVQDITKQFSGFISSNNVNIGPSEHNISYLMTRYILDTLMILFILVGTFFFSKFTKKIKNRILNPILIISLLVGIFAATKIFSGFYLGRSIEDFTTFALFGIMIILFKENHTNPLLFSSLFIMGITPLGSNTGLHKLFYGMWLTLPLALLIIKNTDSKYIILAATKKSLKIIPILLILVCLIYTSIYTFRDANRFELNTKFNDKSLNYIHSTELKVSALDELLEKVRDNTNPKDEILAGLDLPMIYYLTDTKPIFGPGWLSINSNEKIEQDLTNIIKENNLPKLFIYSKRNLKLEHWTKEEPNSMLNILTKTFSNLKYNKIWENDVFVMYKLP